MKRVLLGLLMAVLTLIAATGLGLGTIHITDFPYTADIGYLNISENTGLSRDEIMANYGAVMEYLSPFNGKEFDLPTLKHSESGAQHFADCKVVFNAVYLAALVSVIAMALLFAFRVVDKRALKYSGIFTIAIPLILALAMAIDFDAVFVLFHAVFFDEGTWIFDSRVDEIIRILPSDFFMHCTAFIASFWVAGAAAELIIGTRGGGSDKIKI